jgi:hypothetical protein
MALTLSIRKGAARTRGFRPGIGRSGGGRALAAIGAWQEVARRIAHEIKNPLTPIQLSTERILRLLERMGTESPPQDLLSAVGDSAKLIGREVGTLKPWWMSSPPLRASLPPNRRPCKSTIFWKTP